MQCTHSPLMLWCRHLHNRKPSRSTDTLEHKLLTATFVVLERKIAFVHAALLCTAVVTMMLYNHAHIKLKAYSTNKMPR